ncbi:MAG: glycerol kinase GlpK [Firmicutes bacterium]|nr:glycerol kinase GlpK [Bacillota bacterium]
MTARILSLDQGTTGTTAILWDERGLPLGRAAREHRQYYPRPGWVEHDPEEIWRATLAVAEEALREGETKPARITAIGITNQRETVVFWDRSTGRPLTNAIVWQCRRTAPLCRELKKAGREELFREKTGLVLDPYFSGTKIRWALEEIPAVQEAARRGRLACGTIDSYLLYRLTGGRVHATDYSNASRTLLFNIKTLEWDGELLDILGVPENILPAVMPSSVIYGETDPDAFLGVRVPVSGIAGDQQAALFGQACFEPGMVKNTYGTGSFLLMNTGSRAIRSEAGLLTTIAWGIDGAVEYALEGSIFITGAAIQWLRDGLQIIGHASETGPLAAQVEDSGGVYLVPAFVGLGAPYWDPYARGLLIGITRGTSRAHLARAVVEAMAYQTCDVLEIMRREAGIPPGELRIDGGAGVMDLLLQFQADLAGLVVRRPATLETTALGAAFLAGLAVGVWPDRAVLAERWREDAAFRPQMDEAERGALYRNWLRAVERSRGWIEEG